MFDADVDADEWRGEPASMSRSDETAPVVPVAVRLIESGLQLMRAEAALAALQARHLAVRFGGGVDRDARGREFRAVDTSAARPHPTTARFRASQQPRALHRSERGPGARHCDCVAHRVAWGEHSAQGVTGPRGAAPEARSPRLERAANAETRRNLQGNQPNPRKK